MKRGQVEPLIFLVMELILVALMIFLYHQIAYEGTSVTHPEVDASLTLSSLRVAPPHLQHLQLTHRLPQALEKERDA